MAVRVRRAPLRLALLQLAVLLPQSARADNNEQPPQPNAPTAFTLLDIDGKTHAGALIELTADRVVLDGPPRIEVPSDRVVRLERKDRPNIAGESLPVVLLANGDRLALRIGGMTDDAVEATWARFPTLPALKVPLETIRGCLVTPPESKSARHALERLLSDRRENSDVVFLTRGDLLTGELLGWKEDVLTLKGAAGEIALQRTQVQGAGLNSELVSFPKAEGRRQLVRLVDGSQVTVRNAVLKDSTLSAEAAFGPRLEWPVTAIACVRFLGGSLKHLSELQPASYRHTPFVAGTWPLAVNRNVAGRPLTLRGVEFPLGLGMHSRSEATYNLAGRYRTFLATAGIDDEAKGQGNVTFTVEVDGVSVFTSPPQTGASPPLSIGSLDVAGKKSLKLIVDYGQRGDIEDHADWCDAVLQTVP